MVYQRRTVVRKIIHFSLGLIIWMLSNVVEKDILLYLILAGTLFSFLTFNVEKFKFLHKVNRYSLGTLFYPVGILSSYLILYNQPLYYFQSSLLVLSISDCLAYFAGQVKTSNSWFRTIHDIKSIYGITIYFLSAFLIIYLFLRHRGHEIEYILFVVMWAVIFEAASVRGSDNFSIPAGIALVFLLTGQNDADYVFLNVVLIVLIPACYFLYKFNILSRLGSFFAFLLGFYLAGIMGFPWFITVLIFFLSSAAFTKLQHSIKGENGISMARNVWQVIANIIWAVICSALFLITRNDLFIQLFIVFVAAVTADTWASEIGPLLNKKCFSMSAMIIVPAGTNGAISFFGSLAALMGATVISAISYYLFFGTWEWPVIAILSISAFFACFVDSILGSFIESRMSGMNYFSKRRNQEMISPNDIINLAGSLTASIFYLTLSLMFRFI